MHASTTIDHSIQFVCPAVIDYLVYLGIRHDDAPYLRLHKTEFLRIQFVQSSFIIMSSL